MRDGRVESEWFLSDDGRRLRPAASTVTLSHRGVVQII